MKTLTEYLKEIGPNRYKLDGQAILVCPKRKQFHIFSYFVKTRGDLCDIGKHVAWQNDFSVYTGEWVSTDEVAVVDGELK